MLHGRQSFGIEVLNVASAAVLDVCMKNRWLPLQDLEIVSMANNTLGSIDPSKRGVTRSAIIFQKRVSRGQCTGTC